MATGVATAGPAQLLQCLKEPSLSLSIGLRGHRRNIERYCRLLATELTDLERQYLHKRIAEEHAQLERLKTSEEEQHAEAPPISTDEHCDKMGAGE
jgi:hypothetical protein